MPDIFNASFTALPTTGITTVNTDAGNLLTVSGEYGAGLYMRNDNSDGNAILGQSYTDVAGIKAKKGRRWSITFQIQDTVNGTSVPWGLTTLGTGLTHWQDTTNSFNIYHGIIGAGQNVGGLMGNGVEPSGAVVLTPVAGTTYTGIIEVQNDGSGKAYYIDPAAPSTEVLLSTSNIAGVLKTPFTLATPTFFCTSCVSEWDTGNHKGLTVNTIRVYDVTPLSVSISSTSQAQAGIPLQLSATVLTSGPAVTYLWESTPSTDISFDDATSATPSVTTSVAGEFEITVTVDDGVDSAVSNTMTLSSEASAGAQMLVLGHL